jgi:hypothetical protein
MLSDHGIDLIKASDKKMTDIFPGPDYESSRFEESCKNLK